MNQNYTQTVEIDVDKQSKTKQYVGIALVLVSFGFVFLSIFVNWFCMIGFGLSFALGMASIQLYNSVAKEFVYDFSSARFVVTKKTVINRYKRVLVLLHNDVENLRLMQNLLDDACIIACNKTHAAGVYELIFKEGEHLRRLLFEPDEYMLALMLQTYGDKCEKDNYSEIV